MYSEIYKPNGMVHTPKSIMEVDNWIMNLNGGERVAAMTAAYMMYNFFCTALEEKDKALREWIKKEKEEAKAISIDRKNRPLYECNMGMAVHAKLRELLFYLDEKGVDINGE